MSRLSRVYVLACILVASPALTQAQERPDFTGTWIMDMTRSESAAQRADASPRTPVTVAIAHALNAVNIETETDGRKEVVTYSFASRPPAPIGTSGTRHADDELTSSVGGPTREPTTGRNESRVDLALAEYTEGRLKTTTVYRVNGMAMKKVEHRSLTADGREMLVETLVQVEHGYQSSRTDAPAYTVVKDVYTKK